MKHWHIRTLGPCVWSLLNRTGKAGDRWDHVVEVKSRGHIDNIAGLDAGYAASGRSDLRIWSPQAGLYGEPNVSFRRGSIDDH